MFVYKLLVLQLGSRLAAFGPGRSGRQFPGNQVVKPGKDESADETVNQSPYQTRKTPPWGDAVAAVNATDKRQFARRTVESDYPPGDEKQTKTPDKTACKPEGLCIQFHSVPPKSRAASVVGRAVRRSSANYQLTPGALPR